MKKLALAVLSAAALNANAAMYMAPKCESANVTVPCEANAWDLGIDLLYLRNQENILSGFTHQAVDNGAGYQADDGYGFRLESSYHFGTGHDVNLNWMHYSKTTSTTNFFTTNSTDELISKMDVVNFELGQRVDVGEVWDLRVHGGLQYARLRNDVRFDVNDDVGANVTGDADVNIRGFGPRVGMDSTFDFGQGVSLFANGAIAALKSKMDVSLSDDFAHRVLFTEDFSRHMSTVATDARIGVMYTHAMAQGDMTIRGGYQVNNFINSNSGVSDISWSGWFVGAHWLGNA